MKTNLTVVVPTLNNVKGLKYLRNYFSGKEFRLIVVDNKKKNLGFSGGVNKGAKKVKTRWMLILNDDIEFLNDKTLLYLIKAAKAKKLDALSPILVNSSGEVENYGYKILPYGRVSLVKEIPRYARDDRGGVKNIDGLTAACLLIKTKVFKKLGGFDERFFAYLEDVDFFLRFKKAGYKMGLATNIEVLHNHMITTKTMGNFKARQDMINWWRLYFKHPDKFKFDLRFIIERLRNVSGFIKATLK